MKEKAKDMTLKLSQRATNYLSAKSTPPGRTSSLRKLMRAKRITDGTHQSLYDANKILEKEAEDKDLTHLKVLNATKKPTYYRREQKAN